MQSVIAKDGEEIIVPSDLTYILDHLKKRSKYDSGQKMRLVLFYYQLSCPDKHRFLEALDEKTRDSLLDCIAGAQKNPYVVHPITLPTLYDALLSYLETDYTQHDPKAIYEYITNDGEIRFYQRPYDGVVYIYYLTIKEELRCQGRCTKFLKDMAAHPKIRKIWIVGSSNPKLEKIMFSLGYHCQGGDFHYTKSS